MAASYAAGGICGDSYGSGSGTISNCYNIGNVANALKAGGICGISGRITISNCYNTRNITASTTAGGIYGSGSGPGPVSISNCYNTGDMTASLNEGYAGGIYGSGSGSISNCYNTGDMAASYAAGGIFGSGSGSVSNSYNTGTISDSQNGGGICGNNTGSISINNCYNTGEISSSHIGGGICGSSTFYNPDITNCYNIGAVSVLAPSSAGYTSAGGICGFGGYISNCYNTGEVSARFNSTEAITHSTYAGGICGSNSGSINNCYNTGLVFSECINNSASSAPYAGGICGSGSGSINNCYNAGLVSAVSVNASPYVGGIYGYCYGYSASINNCYNTGVISASGSSPSVGGVFGASDMSVNNCYWNIDSYQIVNNIFLSNANKKGMGTVNITDTTTGKTTEEMGSRNFVILLNENRGPDLEWIYDDKMINNGYPIFINQADYPKQPIPVVKIDYINETLTGLVNGGTHSFNDDAPVVITEAYAIQESWFGSSVSIVKKGDGTTILDSDPLILPVPVRPNAPTPGKADCTTTQNNNGMITGVNNTMEYSDNGTTWISITDTAITNLSPGIYYLRVKATAASFKSKNAIVIINPFQKHTIFNTAATVTGFGAVSASDTWAAKGDTVTFTVCAEPGYRLKNGMLYYSVDSGATRHPLYVRVGASGYSGDAHSDSTVDQYTLTMPATDISIYAEFVPIRLTSSNAAETALSVFGVSYHPDSGSTGAGLRFGSRVLREINIDGKDYTLRDCGTLLIRSDYLLVNPKTGGSWQDWESAHTGGKWRNVNTTKLLDRCTEYVDFAANIIGLTVQKQAHEYVAVCYGIYADSDGNTLRLESGLSRAASYQSELGIH